MALNFTPGYRPNISRVDPRLVEILTAAASGLPDGYHVTISEGYNAQGHATKSQHKVSGRGALDMQIFGPDGQAIKNKGIDKSGMYTLLAQNAYAYASNKYPTLAKQLAWGGSFGTTAGSGVPDLMHFDLGGPRKSAGKQFYPVLAQLGPPKAGQAMAYAGETPITPAEQAATSMAQGAMGRTLRKGMTGDDVRVLQQQLADAGLYKGKIDGDYGRQTAAAVRAAESRYGLSRDRGVAGPQVQTALGNASSAQRIASTIDTFGAPSGGSATPSVSPTDYALNGAPPWAGPASQFSVGAGTMPGGAPEPSAPWQNPLNAGPRISQASRVPMFPIQAPIKGYGGDDVSFTPHQPPSPAPVGWPGAGQPTGPEINVVGVPAADEAQVPLPRPRPSQVASAFPTADRGLHPTEGLGNLGLLADFNNLTNLQPQMAEFGGGRAPDAMKSWLTARGSKAPPQGFGANNLYNAGETAPWDKPFDANELVSGIGNFFDPNGTGFSLGTASRGLNDLLGGSEPATAKPSLYDRVPPAVSAPSAGPVPTSMPRSYPSVGAGLSAPMMPPMMGPQSSLGGYPQIASADPSFTLWGGGPVGTAQQSSIVAPQDDQGAMWMNGQRDIEPPGRDDLFHLLPTRNETTPPTRWLGVGMNEGANFLPGGPQSDTLEPAGGPPLSPGGAGYTFGGFGAPGSISWDAPSILPQALPSPSPAQTQSILPPQKEPSRPGGTQGGRFGDFTGRGNQVYATSLPYTNMGTTPWGSSFFSMPNGGFSNSPYTPAGWTAPNFNSKSGGNSYAYDPVSRTYMTSDGRVLSMD